MATNHYLTRIESLGKEMRQTIKDLIQKNGKDGSQFSKDKILELSVLFHGDRVTNIKFLSADAMLDHNGYEYNYSSLSLEETAELIGAI